MRFRVINVKYHKARKTYTYYNGVITPGQYYYRGFAVVNKQPFEFFFKDNNFFLKGKIPLTILKKEFEIHFGKTRYNQPAVS